MNTLINILGTLLNLIYNLVNNFGLAVIIFAFVTKLIQIPLDIKARVISAQTAKMQEKHKELKEKHGDNVDAFNKELMEHYKRENINPLSSCSALFIGIFQIVLVIAMFTLIASPLTYMKKIDENKMNQYFETAINQVYEEKYKEVTEKEGKTKEEVIEKLKNENKRNKEMYIIKNLKGEESKELKLNMSFLSLDLSEHPGEFVKKIEDIKDINKLKLMIIPILYIIISFINISIVQKDFEKQREEAKKKKESEKVKERIIENKHKFVTEEEANKNKEDDKFTADDFQDVMLSSNKTMKYIMPIMIFSITMITPLGLALYWLFNTVFDIVKIKIVKEVSEKQIKEKGLN